MKDLCIYRGKVRDIYEVGENHLVMNATDRVSAFDKHIGIIPGKGELLNKMSEYWFNQTRHIIDNHLVDTFKSVALVKKTTPYKIEFIIRAYITGNTRTSLWVNYKNGKRRYCDNVLPDGLTKNQKLPFPIITPTTKGDVDIPITRDEIIKNGYMTADEYDYIASIAFKLFSFGQATAEKCGFILVDTKYEFGKTSDCKIILIDELHTCDSSRYWIKDTYEYKFNKGIEPDKFDKDCIRDWVKSSCKDPYKDIIPELPTEIISWVYNNYNLFYKKLTYKS